MLTRFDDYLIHQTIDTLDHVVTGDPRFQDRGLFIIHGKGGDFLLQVGFGVYPNQNMIDAWVCAVRGETQYNMRVARPLKNDRSDLNVGPLHIEILEPMVSWRVWTDKNDYDLDLDVTFHARAPALEFKPVFVRRNNYVEHHQMHLMQSGRYTGRLRIGDYQAEGPFIGCRDRTWGVRGPQMNQPFDQKRHRLVSAFEPAVETIPEEDLTRRAWIAAEFDDYSLYGWFQTDRTGKLLIADGGVVDCASGETKARFLAWQPPKIINGPRYPEAVEMTLVDDRGGVQVLTARPLLARNGGNNYTSYGRQRPSLHTEGGVYDLADPQFRKDHGYMAGSLLAEFDHSGNVGYGLLITQMLARPA